MSFNFALPPPNPWVKHSSETEFENNWITVQNYDVTNPADNKTAYGVVRFKNRAVGVVPYEDGYIWMVGQTRFALGEYHWEIPEGGVPIATGESMKAAGRRELAEETGLRAETLTPLFQVHLSNSVTDEWGQVFLATGLRQGEDDLEDSEDITVLKISLDEAYDAVESGNITDSLTVTAVYKLKLMQAMGELD